MKLNWSKIYTDNELINKIYFVAASFVLDISCAPPDLRIDILQYPEGGFKGVCNYVIGQSEAIFSNQPMPTIEEALNVEIKRIVDYLPENPVDFVWNKIVCV
jgi:hypothetical protein